MSKKYKLPFFEAENDDRADNNIDLTENFDKALKKKQFQGEKGKMLFELQKSYNNTDNRFSLDTKFKNDISYKRLPKDVKESTSQYNQSKEFSYNTIVNTTEKDEEIVNERNKNVAILSSLLSTNDLLTQTKESNNKRLMIKRYDPTLNLGSFGAKVINEEVKVDKTINKDENVIKLNKGVEVFKEPSLLNPYDTKYRRDMKKRELKMKMSDKMNEINDNMNGEVIVNYDKWKDTIQSKKKTTFKLFGDDNRKEEEDHNEISVNEEEEKQKEISHKDKDKKTLIPKEETSKEKDKRLLRNKTKRDKKKEKQRLQKEKEILNEQNLTTQFETIMNESYGEDKAKNYLKYIEMINKNKSKNKHK